MITIQENVDLKPFNTFGISAKARYFTQLTSIADIQELIHTELYKNKKHIILGGGSNILLTNDLDALICKIDVKGIKVVSQTDTHVTLKVGAGEVWHELVMHCVNNNWGGIENLSLIPGTVGAAPMQNIGAYGVEVKEVIDFVEAVHATSGEVVIFTKDDCQFGYRESVFKLHLKDNYFISSVTLTLTKKNHQLNTSYGAIQDTLKEMNEGEPNIQSISRAVIKIRQQKLPDPQVIGNAGSFFKNPTITTEHFAKIQSEFPTLPGYKIENQGIKVPAAWLIEQCGWKGKRINNIGVHQHQPLVLVNFGNGNGSEIWKLAESIQQSVKEKFQITLQPEVNVL